jgi:hypothetical protein
MKIILILDSQEEFSQFICSTAERYWSLMDNVSEVCIGDVIYAVAPDTKHQPANVQVVNYMLNDVQIENDSIWISKNGETFSGSQLVRRHIEELPENFSLRVGWRTDYSEYSFTRNP